MPYEMVSGDLDDGVPMKCKKCTKYDDVHHCSAAFIVAVINMSVKILKQHEQQDPQLVIPDFQYHIGRVSFEMVCDHVLDDRDMEKEFSCFTDAIQKAKEYNLKDALSVKEELFKEAESLVESIERKVRKMSGNPFLDAFNNAAHDTNSLN